VEAGRAIPSLKVPAPGIKHFHQEKFFGRGPAKLPRLS
jgi:hypothetical protein